MNARLAATYLFLSGCVGIAGCGGDAPSTSTSLTPVSVDASRYLLTEEPDGAVGVIDAKQSAADGEPLVLVGRIGGAANPWVDGRAAFTLIDASMSVVADGQESAEGEICTGDCCATERLGCTTLVKFVDENGRVLPVDSRKLLGVAAEDMVVIRGKAKKDKSGNFTMLATGLYARK